MSILTSSRFAFEPPPTGTEALRRVRAAWISDVHLGTRTSNAEALLQFLRDYDCDRLIREYLDPGTCHSRGGRWSPHPGNSRTRTRHRRPECEVVGLSGRRRIPVSTLAQSSDQFRAPPLRSRLLVAQRLREKASQGRGQLH